MPITRATTTLCFYFEEMSGRYLIIWSRVDDINTPMLKRVSLLERQVYMRH